jgi:ParB/RepB/Spo0J family partition protein
MRKTEKWLVNDLVVDPKNRKSGQSEDDLRALGENMQEHGQFTHPWIRPDGKVIFGNRKVLAARLVGITHLDCVVIGEDLSETQLSVLNLSENLLHVDMSAAEKWKACVALLELNPTWTHKDLAAHLKLDPSTITRIMAPSKCIPAWQEAFLAGVVGVTDCYAAAKVGTQEQHEMLAQKHDGASRDDLERHRRKPKRRGIRSSAKESSISIPLPSSGLTVIFRGINVGIDDLIEAAGDVRRAAIKGRDDDQLDAKGFEIVMRQKAKGKSRSEVANV